MGDSNYSKTDWQLWTTDKKNVKKIAFSKTLMDSSLVQSSVNQQKYVER